LDNEANLVDEEVLVDILEKASDYGFGLSQLNPHQKTLVEKVEGVGWWSQKCNSAWKEETV
jgi:hypothetical protein